MDPSHPLKKENITKQVGAIRDSGRFKDHVVHSLRMHSHECRSVSCSTLLVHVEEGYGLGEIKSLKRFEVMKSKEATEEYKRSPFTSRDNSSEGAHINAKCSIATARLL
mgnify:CR=1 FL=1